MSKISPCAATNLHHRFPVFQAQSVHRSASYPSRKEEHQFEERVNRRKFLIAAPDLFDAILERNSRHQCTVDRVRPLDARHTANAVIVATAKSQTHALATL